MKCPLKWYLVDISGTLCTCPKRIAGQIFIFRRVRKIAKSDC